MRVTDLSLMEYYERLLDVVRTRADEDDVKDYMRQYQHISREREQLEEWYKAKDRELKAKCDVLDKVECDLIEKYYRRRG